MTDDSEQWRQLWDKERKVSQVCFLTATELVILLAEAMVRTTQDSWRLWSGDVSVQVQSRRGVSSKEVL